MTATASFGTIQFGSAPLRHQKRAECLVKIADLLHRHPGGTLPEKLHAPKDYKATDRPINRPEVTHASVLAGPFERMRDAGAARHDGIGLYETSFDRGSGLDQRHFEPRLPVPQ